jgi:hypothetical protein
LYAQLVQVAVNGRNVAKANNPFWLFQKLRKIKLVEDSVAAITATGGKNRMDFRIVEHSLQIAGPQVIVARKLKITTPEGFTFDHVQPPFIAKNPKSGFEGFIIQTTGHGQNADPLAGL